MFDDDNNNVFCFQIQDITIEGETKEKRSAKDALLLWCQSKTVGLVSCTIHYLSGSRVYSCLLGCHGFEQD